LGDFFSVQQPLCTQALRSTCQFVIDPQVQDKMIRGLKGWFSEEHQPFLFNRSAISASVHCSSKRSISATIWALLLPRGEFWCLETGSIDGRLETDGEAMYRELDERLLFRLWQRPDGKNMRVSRAFQDSGGHAGEIVHKMVKQRARVLWAYRGSGDLQGPWKCGTDTLTHTRLIQGNANHLKEMLAAKLDITSPGPGYIHFPLNPEAGFDEEFFRQLLSERREKRMRNGVMTVRWLQTRERNEALDLVCMVLCCALTYRGAIDTIAPQVVTGDVPSQRAAQPVAQAATQSPYGVLPGSERLAAQLGVTSQVTRREQGDLEERRTWGVQPSSGSIWDL
jgi:phage terminase large subunit GpA-like protein